MKAVSRHTFLLFAAAAFIIASFVFNAKRPSGLSEFCAQASLRIAAKEKIAGDALQLIKQSDSQEIFKIKDRLFSEKEFLDKEGILILGFRNDSLKFWTNSVSAAEIKIKDLKNETGILHLQSGWYLFKKNSAANNSFLALLLIKPEYDVTNAYFSNEFSEWLNLPKGSEIVIPSTNNENAVKNIEGEPLFELSLPNENSGNEGTLPALLFITGIAFFLFAIIKFFKNQSVNKGKFIVISIAFLALRIVMIYFKFPSFLYDSVLYDLSVYGTADSFFNGFLGDILLNVLFFYCWTVLFYFSVNLKTIQHKYRLFLSGIYLIILFSLAIQLNTIVKNLVLNSTISLDFSDFFSLSPVSFLCLSIIFINGFSIAIHAEKLNELFLTVDNRVIRLFYFAALFAYSSLFALFFHEAFTVAEWFWIAAIVATAYFFRKYGFAQSILSAGFRILFFSAIISIIVGGYNSLNEELKLKHLAEQLSDKQDAFLESEFIKTEAKIKKDKQLLSALGRLPLFADETEKSIRQLYFTRYFEKYHIKLAVFDSLCMPYFRHTDYRFSNNEFFEEQIHSGEFTISENLFFTDSGGTEPRYIGKIEINKITGHKPSYTLYVMMQPKHFNDAGTYTDLMLDAIQQKQSRHKNLSYAIYRKKKLVSAYGKFVYPAYFNDKIQDETLGAFRHFVNEPDNNTKIIVTGSAKNFAYYFTNNSYYFLFFSVCSLLFFFLYHRLTSSGIPFFTLNRRIQFFIVGVLFLALTALGIFTVKLVIKQSEEEQTQQLTSKAGQLQQILSEELFYNNKFDYGRKIYAETILQKYATFFNSDISLFSENGVLFASSRPEIYISGLNSGFVNPLAIEHFRKNKSLYYVTYDYIGKLKYLSVYQAIYNDTGKISGYINLPYFARQKDLEEGVSDYITTLINIYVVLFLVSLFTGLIVSVYITKPLRILQEQLGKISLGKKNESIHWQSDDEIGKLVNEYNKMLMKLEESAVLLAKSEREGAWQEMARQVAHEIKNPLTPMKLNIQYLQKLAAQKDADFEDRFKKLSASIIEQIDALAHIAGEFSNFAKMPNFVLENVNLNEVIRSSSELFVNEENIKIEVVENEIKAIVKADKKQCLRVFNNLIKNAIQAIPDNKPGVIKIVLKELNDQIEVVVSDNGIGIPENMKEKIFVPNFTTKTTGTGLGLAMVKNIMNAFGGNIRFESKENEGTAFFLYFQKA